MLGQSSVNTSLSNHVGSFEFAGWQEMNDSSLEQAGSLGATPFTLACGGIPTIRCWQSIDDSSLEQAAQAIPPTFNYTPRCFVA